MRLAHVQFFEPGRGYAAPVDTRAEIDLYLCPGLSLRLPCEILHLLPFPAPLSRVD